MGCDLHWHSETRVDGQWKCDQANTRTIEIVNYGDREQEHIEMANFPGHSRDYWFFGLLAEGVRTDWAWSFTYQGSVPDDLSDEVAELYKQWDCDAHSAGFVTRAQLLAKLEELKLIQAELLINPPSTDEVYTAQVPAHHVDRLNQVIADMRALSPDVSDDDHRLVFWFDN